MVSSRKKRLGIIGGLGPIAGADILFKLVKATPAARDDEHLDVIFEQHPFDGGGAIADENFNPNSRKLHVFDMIGELQKRDAEEIVLNCFISHTFLDEIVSEISIPVIDMMTALREHIAFHFSDARKIGVLTSTYVRNQKLFEKTFADQPVEIIYPSDEVQTECVMQAVYGADGIKSGYFRGKLIERIETACRDLADRGAEVILPGFTELPVVLDALSADQSIPILDTNQIYADYAVSARGEQPVKSYKIGIIGGVGPAATVDFMDKIVSHTDAASDQEHVKMVVEHNPQIPDRTENLVGDGPDPTIPLYAAARKLQEQDADLIAIPCNTAHAYVERLQHYLSVPVVNMVYETVEYLKSALGREARAGLLATTGTVESRVYADIADEKGVSLMVPDAEFQADVMAAIYGPQGVKAGHTAGVCRDQLIRAATHLVEQGADALILGCTELPLILTESEMEIAGRRVALLDPTDILARKCLDMCQYKVV